MELAQLRLVRQVLESGSISKAALQLNRAHSLISRQISSLEKECGDRIFHRNGRGVTLTEFGEKLLPKIDLVLETTLDISAEAQTRKDEISGKVRVGAIPPVARSIAVPLLQCIQENYPNITLSLSEEYSGNLEANLAEGDLDIAIFLRNGTAVGREDSILAEWDTYLIGLSDSPILQKEAVCFSALDGIPLLLHPAPNFNRELIDGQSFGLGMKFNVVAEINGSSLMMQLVLSGMGYLVSCLDPSKASAMTLAGQEIANGKLKASLIVEPSFRRTFVLSMGSMPRRSTQVIADRILKIIKEQRAN